MSHTEPLREDSRVEMSQLISTRESFSKPFLSESLSYPANPVNPLPREIAAVAALFHWGV
jgi:hypothetical protein